MTTKVVRTTSKGQITIPQEWRARFATDSFLLKMREDSLVIMPVNLQELEPETVVFDADRDNKGKGITPAQMIRLLKKIKHG